MRVKFIALVLVLGYIVWQNVLAWPVMGTPRTYSSYPARTLAHKYTQDDLEKYASGKIADGRLTSDVTFAHIIGSYELEAAFVSPNGTVVTMLWYGWPTVVVQYQSLTDYDDVYAKTNPSPGDRISNSGWRGLSYFRRHIDAGNRFQNFGFLGRQLIVPLVVVVVAFSFGCAVRSVLIVSRFAQKSGRRLRDRFTHRMSIICAIACTIGVSIASVQPSRYPDQIYLATSTVTPTKTGLTNTDIVRLKSSPTGEAEIARAILDAAGGTAADPDDALVIGGSVEVAMTIVERRGGWPDYTWYQTRWTLQEPDYRQYHRARVTLSRGLAEIDILVRRGDPPVRVDDYGFLTYNVARLLLGLFAAWWAAGLAVWLIGWRVRRRTAKRVARGWCARCGYDLSGL
ncbi:MAG: hypothetical protein IH985_08195 [Planctomycetes bacterium]|nr:hypothetical protein [Planctomycetota bacterium]